MTKPDNKITKLPLKVEQTEEPLSTPLESACARMREAELPHAVVENYRRLLKQVLHGDTGIIEEDQIEPVGHVDTLAGIRADDVYLKTGQAALSELAVIRLNGGLGSSMGMPNAKSLLTIRDNLTFNDLMIEQLRHLQGETGHRIPLIHMTSFRTDGDIRQVMAAAGYANPAELPSTFQQHKHLKIYADDFSPAGEPTSDHNWNPPGHGDIYAALLATGIADKLLQAGKRYLFVANSDNLGATVAPEILGYMIHNHCPFLMETCRRTDADKKGGHLAKDKQTGNLILREVAQAPTLDGQVISAFSDIERYSQFNTNSIWLDLKRVVDMAKLHNGCIPLPLIRNLKPVNTEDPSSRKAIQIETAMGAAIGVFGGARALEVPRDRFMPVKTNNELLLLMSDVYDIVGGGQVVVREELRGKPLPRIQLDHQFFGMIRDFNQRVIFCPSLEEASTLTVRGNWRFDRPVRIKGEVILEGLPDVENRIPDGIEELADTTFRPMA
jgi:UTP--glucose-1-phosphate uridylyltransferase